MKNLIPALLIFLLVFCGCYDHENDLIDSRNCKDCTHLSGRITTTNGTVPMPNMNMELNWVYGKLGEFRETIRKKAVFRTDKNGYYDLVFQIRDEEFTKGDFKLIVNIDPKIYFNTFGATDGDWKSLDLPGLEKDTSINLNYNIPKKAFVEMQITNPVAIKPQDYFVCDYTLLEGIDGKQNTNLGLNLNNREPRIFEVAAEQPVILKFVKVKNGISSEEIDTLELKPLQTYKYSITF